VYGLTNIFFDSCRDRRLPAFSLVIPESQLQVLSKSHSGSHNFTWIWEPGAFSVLLGLWGTASSPNPTELATQARLWGKSWDVGRCLRRFTGLCCLSMVATRPFGARPGVALLDVGGSVVRLSNGCIPSYRTQFLSLPPPRVSKVANTKSKQWDIAAAKARPAIRCAGGFTREREASREREPIDKIAVTLGAANYPWQEALWRPRLPAIWLPLLSLLGKKWQTEDIIVYCGSGSHA